ncbi:MAG TPA: hypothetical protein VGE39_15025 [Prosthecobacter sp.]
MADTHTQIQSTAQAPAAGSTPAAPGTSSTPAIPTSADPLDAALDLAFAETGTQAASNANPKQGGDTTTTTGDEPGAEGGAAGVGENADGTTTTTTALTDEEIEAALPAEIETIDPEHPPKGMENIPKPIWQRFKKMSEQLRGYRTQLAEGAFIIQATPTNPLSEVSTLADLDVKIAEAKDDRAWAQANREGGTRKQGSKTVEIDGEQAAKMLQDAQAIIDADAATRLRISDRQRSKPWVTAQAIAPEMFEAGKPDHTFVLGVLEACPQIATQIPEWEYLLAAAAKGMRMVVEERDKRAVWKRFELDKDGNIIPPAKPAKETPKGAQTPKPPVNPGAARPPLRTTKTDAAKTDAEVLASMPEDARPSDRLDALLGQHFA